MTAAASFTSPWLTVPEAAAYSRVGRSKIYDACRGGGLTATQTHAPKGTWIVHRDRIDEWISDGMPMAARPVRRLRSAP